MKAFMLALTLVLLLVLWGGRAGAYMSSYGPPVYYGGTYPYGYSNGYGSPYGYPYYPYAPYPLPPAPSFGFGRGGIYGHVFVPRDGAITSYTFPGGDSVYR
jgi:hypothetical protein